MHLLTFPPYTYTVSKLLQLLTFPPYIRYLTTASVHIPALYTVSKLLQLNYCSSSHFRLIYGLATTASPPISVFYKVSGLLSLLTFSWMYRREK